ncbi:Fic family protein [Candidatus Aquiluna sp. UB-MaderosW2red]|jgi:Fic family protein|uniref:Fic family protein n=1 Tax=Candidatus Aquiluna sp. UB-MaderosW2red TaxID=1855377 RepID=UPI000875DC7C|nr:Fic family protein [Candidatus Aquiluna sp. UB-MaderosW2red]SCX09518.1 Fic family protein [Candidatus Aquiluna sp. UB-MaderosW2red]
MKQPVFFGSIFESDQDDFPYPYFMPNLIPVSIEIGQEAWSLIAKADAAVGELRGITRLISPSNISNRAALLKDSLASSRIEGTQATLAEVLEADLRGELVHNADVEQVLNYLKALEFATKFMERGTISTQLILETHSILMNGRLGADKTPGVFRKTPVWIGSRSLGVANARFIPPLAKHIPELITDLVEFISSPSPWPLAAKIAWAHYQFETIHPFLDGNGRIGRILIELMFISENALAGPYLGISQYIEQNRDEYYFALQEVRFSGETDQLYSYFAIAIERQALQTSLRMEALLALSNTWLDLYSSAALRMSQLVRHLISNPIVDVSSVQSSLGVTQPTASKLLRRAQGLGLIQSKGTVGRSKRERWLAQEVWDILSPGESHD